MPRCVTECVLDASAVLAVLRQESGADVVRPLLRGGLISAVNAGEVMNRLVQLGGLLNEIVPLVQQLEMQIVDFNFEQAAVATSLQPLARQANLSFGDRACLSLGMMRRHNVLTADRDWQGISHHLGIEIRLIR